MAVRDDRLYAYVTGDADETALRDWAAERLPSTSPRPRPRRTRAPRPRHPPRRRPRARDTGPGRP
ncbi:hypothetical protein O1L60_01170 [Streptomyces diastatochromogenes]|nr:hypothetical protein [Streptomyces diastatochromogenes]